MNDDPRYSPVADLWMRQPVVYPLTRDGARRAHALLIRRFGSLRDYPASIERTGRTKVRLMETRVCWIQRSPGYSLEKGWARLVHDTSHHVFRYRHPSARPHAHGHDRLEHEMALYVIARELMEKFRVVPRPKLTAADKIERVDAAIARWQTKHKRASNALRKLNAKRKRLAKAVQP